MSTAICSSSTKTMSNEYIYRKPGSRPRRGRAALVIFVLALIAAAALWRQSFFGVLWKGLVPVRFTVAAAGNGLSGIGSGFSSKAALEASNTQLQAQVAQLEAHVADRDTLYQENLQLKAMLGRPDAATNGTILAGVIAAPPATAYDTLVLDAGSAQGVASGDIVTADGTVIGQISDISSGSSHAALFSSAGETHQGFLDGSTPVTVTGDGAGALSTQVPSDTAVAVGDPVSFPGVLGGISETVASIDAPAGNSFKTLRLHLPVDIFELRFVEIRRSTN